MSWQVALSGRVGDLEIEVAFHSADQPVLLVGPNGAGKSSIIRALAGVRNGLDGEVKLGERVLSSTSPDASQNIWVPSEHRRVGYVPQGGGLFDHLSVLDNVAFGCASGAAGQQRASQALQQVDAEALASRRIPTLSGGERQRVALARALAIEPEGFLLDEPLSALDVGKRRATRAFVANLLRTHKRPTVIVTHDVRDLAALPGLVVVLEHGRIVQQGDLAALRERPATEFVAELVMP